MNYLTWIPENLQKQIDYSDLAMPTQDILNEVYSLEKTLNNFCVAYKKQNLISKNSLCSFIKAAELSRTKKELINKAENKLNNCIIVVYKKPIELHENIN